VPGRSSPSSLRSSRVGLDQPVVLERLRALAAAVSAQHVLVAVLVCQLLASAALVAVMALESRINAHPDEELHLLAGSYFREHWLPPAVGARDTTATYSGWGFSYLDEADIAYLLFGKVAAVGSYAGLNPALAMRWFQVLLYWVLIAWTIVRARGFVPMLGFLLLTPQVWYIFSYINGDALPFALLTVLLVELGRPDSPVRAFVSGPQPKPSPGVFLAGALLGLLVLSKLNYLVSVGFVGWAVLWLGVHRWKRLALLVLVAAAIALPWAAYHSWVNDFQTGQRVVEYAERVAAPDFKPSGQGAHPFPYIALRAKGITLWQVLTTLHWVGLSFRSFCGLYGWMNFAADEWMYGVFAVLYAALLAILVLPVAARGPRRAQFLLMGVLVFAGLVLGQSVYRSWVYNFQGQGRYLFPVLPMLFFYWRTCEPASLRVPALVVIALLGMHSLMSFLLIGLGALA
jgi:uncharacterized membrane protein